MACDNRSKRAHTRWRPVCLASILVLHPLGAARGEGVVPDAVRADLTSGAAVRAVGVSDDGRLVVVL